MAFNKSLIHLPSNKNSTLNQSSSLNESLSLNQNQLLQFFNNWSYEDALKIKFKNHKRPEIGTYVVIYTKLAKNCVDDRVWKDILLIGLNVRDEFGNYIYNIDLDENGKHSAMPNFVLYFSKYSKEAVFNYAKNEGFFVPLPPINEEDFKTYMETLCSIFMRFLFKNSFNLKFKTENLSLGIKILGKKYEGSKKYLTINDTLIKNLRNYAKDCIWKENIAVILIKTYAKSKLIKNHKIVSYMSWQIMKTTYLHKFHIIKSINDLMEYTKFDLDTFLKIFLPIGSDQENEILVPILKKVLSNQNKKNIAERIFYNWSGLINEKNLVHFKKENFPITSNLIIGFLNKINKNPLRPQNEPFTEFYSIYYDQGYELANIYEYFSNLNQNQI